MDFIIVMSDFVTLLVKTKDYEIRSFCVPIQRNKSDGFGVLLAQNNKVFIQHLLHCHNTYTIIKFYHRYIFVYTKSHLNFYISRYKILVNDLKRI